VSAKGLQIIQKMIAGEPVDAKSMDMSIREWNELMVALGLPTATSTKA
jgi:hypothetical protein